jgi:hypothetical protein
MYSKWGAKEFMRRTLKMAGRRYDVAAWPSIAPMT